MGFKEKLLKIMENEPELVMRTVVQLVLVVGLVMSSVILAMDMKPVALMQLSKSYGDCMTKTIEATNRLKVVSVHLHKYSKEMEEVVKRFDEIESRLHITTNLMKECSMRMDKMTNGLDKMECMLRKMEQRSYVLRTEGCGNSWWPCYLWKVGCQ